MCRLQLLLDADTIVLKPIDALLDHPSAFAAAPDAFPADQFNSGVMVIRPSAARFAELVAWNAEHGTAEGGDQCLLNDFFSEWRATHRIRALVLLPDGTRRPLLRPSQCACSSQVLQRVGRRRGGAAAVDANADADNEISGPPGGRDIFSEEFSFSEQQHRDPSASAVSRAVSQLYLRGCTQKQPFHIR